MTLGTKEVVPCRENMSNENIDSTISDVTHNTLEEELLTHLANSKAIFKSQQKGDPELTFEEKRTIAGELLEKSHCLFLSKFGHYLKVEHLEYFSKSKDYETVYHVNRLRRYFNSSTRHVDVRNRRYEALKAMIEKGEYFSECEMMKRNPLLYEHLVGQYLTEEEKKVRDTIDTRNTNYVDVLMETIERSKVEKHLKFQQKEEEEAVQEEDDDDDDDNDDDDDDDDNSRDSSTSQRTNSSEHSHSHWGGNLDEKIDSKDKNSSKRLQKRKIKHKNISNEELQLLKQEFVTNMYQSFLDGKDRDFDYRYRHIFMQINIIKSILHTWIIISRILYLK